MTFELEVMIPGDPVAQGRPRFTTRGGFPRAFDPAKSRDWKRTAAAIMRLAMTERDRIARPAPVTVSIVALFRRPKAMKRGSAEWKSTKPDAENIAKAVLDAATGIVYDDDAQVTDLSVQKFYAPSGCAPYVRVSFEVAA